MTTSASFEYVSKHRELLRSIFLSIFFATLIVFFPWDMVSRSEFPDFHNYVQTFDYFYATDSSRIETYHLTSIREYFINEILWDELVIYLCKVMGDPVVALRIISFFIIFIASLYLIQKIGYIFAPLFLFNPAFIDIAMSGIRNGFAYSLVIVAVWQRSEFCRLALFSIATFIHSSALVLFCLYYLTKLVTHYFRGRAQLFLAIIFGVIFGLALTVFSENVLGLIADRRVGSDYLVGQMSPMLSIIWIILLVFQSLSGRDCIKNNIFIISILSWFLVMSLFLPASHRIWAGLLPIIGASIFDFSNFRRHFFLVLYIGYFIIHFFYWSKLLTLLY